MTGMKEGEGNLYSLISFSFRRFVEFLKRFSRGVLSGRSFHFFSLTVAALF